MATGTAGSLARASHYQFPHLMVREFTYADDGLVLTVGKVPANATIHDVYVLVTEAFDPQDSDPEDEITEANTMDIGTTGDGDGFASAIVIEGVGKVAADDMATSNDLGPYASDTAITCTLTMNATAAAAGAGRVVVSYIVKNW